MAADPPPSGALRALLDPRMIDVPGELVPRSGMSDDEIDQVVAVMSALREWHRAAERMSAASRRYMRLNQTDMKAIRFMIAAANAGELVTPRLLADHLEVSSAATTKMLDRLEAAGHIVRSVHPSDRRAIALRVTDETRRAARESVGKLHARRFAVAAALSPGERETVIRFLSALAATEGAADPG